MRPLELLNRTEEDVKTWTLSQDLSALQQTFDEIWQQIRTARLYAGQPRSTESERSVSVARVCLQIARHAGDDGLLVRASRMLAYSLTANEQYKESLAYHERAINGLEAAGDAGQAARARLGYIAALFHSGRYQEALAIAAVAEDWFKKNNDEVGFARLCNNIANLYDRLGERAQACRYHLAHSEIVEKLGDREGLAKSYLNLGNSFAALDQFEKAEEMYELCESLSRQLGVLELGAQASYNRAHLHYLRGRYGDAFQSFSRLRQHFEQSGSRRHYALCDLDEAEIYVQLNQPKDAAALAERAARQFNEIGLRLEQATATAFLGVALFQLRRYTEALDAFQTAEAIFESEGNLYWKGLLDLYRADVHLSTGRYWEANVLAAQAKELFERMGYLSKTIMGLVLLGRIAFALDDISSAEAIAGEMLAVTKGTDVPLLLFPCYLLCASIAERKQEWDRTEYFYEMAAADLEQHQTRLHHDFFNGASFTGKHQVYEALVGLALRKSNRDAVTSAFTLVERAKSRGLIDLLSRHLPSIQGHADQPLLAKVDRLREELHVLYATSQPELTPIPATARFESIAIKEDELARTLREIAFRDPEYTSLQQVSATTIESVQAMLPEHTTLLEYFIARGEVLAFVVSRSRAEVHRHLCPQDRIACIQDRLAFQLENFMLGDEYVRDHSGQIFDATVRHLKELHQYLFAPIAGRIQTDHVTIVPYGFLHLLPFHAFTDGERYVIDDFEVCYEPSASILKYCLEKDDIEDAKPCVMGVSDQTTPSVEREVRALASMFPDCTVLINGGATRGAFAEVSRRTSFLHIATHGLFRQDNPMFSGFKLDDGWVTALDLFSMTCQTNLVTLSGCQSGVSQVTGSDDLLGLMRGFLYAGARSLMLSLWNIDDWSTAELMSHFYDAWRGGASKSKALRLAMKAVRQQRPNPFYWAPFKLVGKG